MLRLNVEGMSCNHCVRSVTETVKSVDPTAEIRVDLAARRVEADTGADAKAVAEAIAAAGYTVVPAQ